MKPKKKSYLPVVIFIAFCALITAAAYTTFTLINKRAHNITATDPRYNTVLTSNVDSIAVMKHNRTMSVFSKGRLLKLYHISLGAQPIGAKHFEGDNKTPEGHYYISVKNHYSSYHQSLGISYPNDFDRQYAKNNGKPTGGDIMIHGLPNSFKGNPTDYTSQDWTAGCISVNNQQIDELYAHVEMLTPITVLP